MNTQKYFQRVLFLELNRNLVEEIDFYVTNLLEDCKKQIEKKLTSQKNQEISKSLIKSYLSLNNIKKEIGNENVNKLSEQFISIQFNFQTEEPVLLKWINICEMLKKEIYQEIIQEW
jgi:hypothetical protein